MFGRYTDSFKTTEQLAAWNTSVQEYDSKNFVKSVISFLGYIRDPKEDNVRWIEKDGVLEFTIYQGTQLIKCVVNDKGISCECKIAKIVKPSVSAMRRLLELNFALDYSQFGFNEDNIIILRYDSKENNSHPNRLYYALRELALSSDKYDDSISDDFSALEMIDNMNTKPLPIELKELKYDFFIKQIETIVSQVNSLDSEKDAGAISWLLMSLVYRLDYLISPQGGTWLNLQKIQNLYYTQENTPLIEKNSIIKIELEKLLKFNKEQFCNDMYDVVNTFAITKNSNPEDIKSSLSESLKSYLHWNNEKSINIAYSVLEHGIGYSLFNFSLPKVMRDFFKLFMNVMYNDYFLSLNQLGKYVENNVYNSNEIKSKINAIVSDNITVYPKLTFNNNSLNCNSKIEFITTYLSELINVISSMSK